MLLTVGCSGPAFALSDKYAITPIEHAACDSDAQRLCFYTFPDEDKLLDCMRSEHERLTPVCLTTLKAGLKKRRMPL